MRDLETRYNQPQPPNARPPETSHDRTLAAAPPSPPPSRLARRPAVLLERRHWLAALAVLFVFFAPYQTLVQTVITDDAVRKGVDIDDTT